MPTILVIDDDAAVCAAIEAMLTCRGFGVCVAPDGPTGLEVVEDMSFDAVIVDICMPSMDGLATARELRRRDPNLPVIAISGHGFRGVRNGVPDFLGMAVKLGASAALPKPFRADELVDAIETCLAMRADRPPGHTAAAAQRPC